MSDNGLEQFDEGTNPWGASLWRTMTASGATIDWMTKEEVDYYNKRRSEYLDQHKYTNVSDLQDLDRLLMLETLVFRWSVFMARGFDHVQAKVDEHSLKNTIKEWSSEIRQLKTSLGLDKVSREKAKSGESVADFIQNLLQRAKEFGYHRNMQYERAVNMIWSLHTMVGTYDRCDEEERQELDLSPESIMDWIRENCIAEWDQIDEDFRENQKIWIRSLT